jgi:putative membrane-bound dehydrogenase-like protein
MAISRIHLPIAVIALSLTGLALAQPADVKSPLSPEESLKHFQLDPLLSIELVAAEPQVVDPVAMRFDEDGRLWVAEMRDYPLGPIKKTDGKRTEKDAEPLSQIKTLEDKDGDGRFETATVFADKLLFATGLQPWKGGVIVTLSGKVAYMKDTDGDGKADVNETWFTGFSESNSQLRANHPTFALDNHIYIANGLRGGMVVNHLKKLLASGGRKPPDTKDKETGDRKQETEDKPINISGMDFRFDPLTGDAEAVSGNGQFGLCFDDWGNRFVCSNRNPCQHVVIENRYLKKAPTVAISSVVQDVAAFAENSRIYPISKFWTTSNLHEGQFTAACGVFISSSSLPGKVPSKVYTCDPTGNLIHCENMEPKGVTFTSKPKYEGKEFLASPDTWFRPVSMERGPDGALYVVDMYRAVIEHPEWVPDELKNRPDERLGDDRGRIYRIVVKGKESQSKSRTQPIGEPLIKSLFGNDAWHRNTGHRLVIERQSQSLAKQLREGTNWTNPDLDEAHVLWCLAGIPGGLDEEFLRQTFHGKQLPEKFARQVLLVSERKCTNPLVVKSGYPGLSVETLDFQRNMTELYLGAEKAAPGGSSLQDPWVQDSVRLRWGGDQVGLLEAVFQSSGFASGKGQNLGMHELGAKLSLIMGQKASENELVELLRQLFKRGVHGSPNSDCLEQFAKGIRKRGTTIDVFVGRLNDSKSQSYFAEMKSRLIKNVESAKTGNPFVHDVEYLGLLDGTSSLLAELAIGNPNVEIRQRAVTALSYSPEVSVWPKIIERYSQQSPVVRQAILDGILQRSERISILLDSLESSSIKPTELDPVQTSRLLKHGDAKIRERAEKIFGSATPEDRKKALADYQNVLTMAGDAKRGQVSFAKNCATCHKIGETGVNVAPDISDSRTKTPAQILADIIQPNRAIDANYVAYNLLLADGTTASGILTSETSTSITLKAAGAKVITVARGEIEQLKSTGVSLMPDGLEKTIPPQEMADVIAFIKNWRYLDGRVPVK